jgi:hypothetical protein
VGLEFRSELRGGAKKKKKTTSNSMEMFLKDVRWV